MTECTATSIWQIGCVVGCSFFVAVELSKFMRRRCSSVHSEIPADDFSRIKANRIIPVFRACLVNCGLATAGAVLNALAPQIPLVVPTALAATSLLLNFAVPARFFRASERRAVNWIFAGCVGYVIGPVHVAVGPVGSVSTCVVASCTLVAHLWCLHNAPTIALYAIGTEVVAPFFVVPPLCGWWLLCGPAQHRLPLWVCGMYAWSIVLHAYAVLAIRWDKGFREQSDDVEERERTISRDAMLIFASVFVGAFLGVRGVVKWAYRQVRVQRRDRAVDREVPRGMLSELASSLVYSVCISGLTLFLLHRYGRGWRVKWPMKVKG